MTCQRKATILIAAFVGMFAQSGAAAEPQSTEALQRQYTSQTVAPAPADPASIDPGRSAIKPARSTADPLAGVTVGAIYVAGAPDIPQSQFAAVIAPYLGRTFSAGEVQDLLASVSEVARHNGYVFATSSVPAQRIAAGVLSISLEQGLIDEVRLEGVQRDEVANLLARLVGKPARQDDLDRLVLLADDFPGVSIGEVRYAREEGRGVLIVPVGYDRVQGWATLDNRGSRALGPVRAQIGVDFSGLLAADDRVTIQGVVTPAQPRELSVIYGRYGYMLPNASTEIAISASYNRSNAGGRWERFDPNGNGVGFNASLTQTLLRGRRQSLWASVDLNYVRINQYWDGAASQRDRVASIGASINGYTLLAQGRLRAGAEVRRGISVLGATARGDPLASRYGAGSEYTLFRGWTSWEGRVHGPVSARLALSAQLTTDPLLAIDQITIGGPYFGRGYEFGERTGDEGVLASGELRADMIDRNTGLLRWMQVYAFADAGDVTNLRGGYGTGDLYSGGGGARFLLASKVRIGLETAVPINHPRYDSGDKSPRISASIGTVF